MTNVPISRNVENTITIIQKRPYYVNVPSYLFKSIWAQLSSPSNVSVQLGVKVASNIAIDESKFPQVSRISVS